MIRPAALVLLIGLLGFVMPGKAAAGPAGKGGCMNGGCHQGLAGRRYLHGPVAAEMAGGKACEMCHLPAGTKCTPENAGVFRLKGEGLCTTCHEKGTGTRHSAAEAEGRCLNCHDPHGSDTSPHMLRVHR